MRVKTKNHEKSRTASPRSTTRPATKLCRGAHMGTAQRLHVVTHCGCEASSGAIGTQNVARSTANRVWKTRDQVAWRQGAGRGVKRQGGCIAA